MVTLLKAHRGHGRSTKRWEDDLNDFVKTEDDEDTHNRRHEKATPPRKKQPETQLNGNRCSKLTAKARVMYLQDGDNHHYTSPTTTSTTHLHSSSRSMKASLPNPQPCPGVAAHHGSRIFDWCLTRTRRLQPDHRRHVLYGRREVTAMLRETVRVPPGRRRRACSLELPATRRWCRAWNRCPQDRNRLC